jgi:hypothetical protein
MVQALLMEETHKANVRHKRKELAYKSDNNEKAWEWEYAMWKKRM